MASIVGTGIQGNSNINELLTAFDAILVLDPDIGYCQGLGNRAWLRIMNNGSEWRQGGVYWANKCANIMAQVYPYGTRVLIPINEQNLALEGGGDTAADYASIAQWWADFLPAIRAKLAQMGMSDVIIVGPCLSPGHQESDGAGYYTVLRVCLEGVDIIGLHHYWYAGGGFLNDADSMFFSRRVEMDINFIHGMGIYKRFAVTEFNRPVDINMQSDIDDATRQIIAFFEYLASLDIDGFYFIGTNTDPGFDSLSLAHMNNALATIAAWHQGGVINPPTLVCDPTLAPLSNLLNDLIQAHGDFYPQMHGWQSVASNPYDWGALRAHIQAITGAVGAYFDPGTTAPVEFYCYPFSGPTSHLVFQVNANPNFVPQMLAWQAASSDPHNWTAFEAHQAATAGYDPGPNPVCEFGPVSTEPPGGGGGLSVILSADKRDIVNGDTVTFSATISGGTPPYTGEMDYGDGTPVIPGEGNPVHTYNLPSTLPFPVSIIAYGVVHDNAGHTAISDGVVVTVRAAAVPLPVPCSTGTIPIGPGICKNWYEYIQARYQRDIAIPDNYAAWTIDLWTSFFLTATGMSGAIAVQIAHELWANAASYTTKAAQEGFIQQRWDALTGQVPAAPSGLQAVVSGPFSITLSWVDNSNNEDGFGIEVSTNGGRFVVATSIGAGATSILLDNLQPGLTYASRVFAYNRYGNSGYSNVVQMTLPFQLPQGLHVTLTATPRVVVPGQAITLTARVSGGMEPYYFNWYNVDVPVRVTTIGYYVFNLPDMGTHTVSVIAEDSMGNISAEVPVDITVVSEITPLQVSISADRTQVEPGVPVNFQANVSGGVGPYSYLWDFGDGHNVATAVPTVSHIYGAMGMAFPSVTVIPERVYPQAYPDALQTYNARVQVTEADGNVYTSEPVQISVSSGPVPEPSSSVGILGLLGVVALGGLVLVSRERRG